MNSLRSIFVRFLWCFLFLVPLDLRAAENANLTGFDAESQAYIRRQPIFVCQWLMPFCSDLTPYWHRENPIKKLGGTDKEVAKKACMYFQEQFLPDGWTYDGRDGMTLKDWVPNNEQGGKREYRRVPNTICPIRTWPNGNPVSFWAWEHRKGDVKVSMLHSYFHKSQMIIMAHKEDGLGFANPSSEELVDMAKKYFRLPPTGLLVPKDWEPVLEISRRDRRFISGILFAKYSDLSNREVIAGLDSGLVGSWGRRNKYAEWRDGEFFYDGFNLALFINPVDLSTGRPDVMARAPHDVDWDRVEKKEIERAAKKKSEKDELDKGKR